LNATATIYDRIQSCLDQFTRAERQLAIAMMENWPMSGLTTITKVAASAGVSNPTVARMAQKLGFRGFKDFQSALRSELEAQISSPIAKHELWSTNVPDTHIVNQFADATLRNLRNTLSNIDPAEFDAACRKLSDLDRRVFLTGGRITYALAEYFLSHFRMIRPGGSLVPSSNADWPHYVMDMKEDDILILFDIRRYQNDLLKFAEISAQRGVDIILLTDQWGSPVTRFATHKFNCRIKAPSAWDSSVAMMTICETMLAAVTQNTWDTAGDRMEDLELYVDATKLFRKFQ